jgi:hypothetical protein
LEVCGNVLKPKGWFSDQNDPSSAVDPTQAKKRLEWGTQPFVAGTEFPVA